MAVSFYCAETKMGFPDFGMLTSASGSASLQAVVQLLRIQVIRCRLSSKEGHAIAEQPGINDKPQQGVSLKAPRTERVRGIPV